MWVLLGRARRHGSQDDSCPHWLLQHKLQKIPLHSLQKEILSKAWEVLTSQEPPSRLSLQLYTSLVTVNCCNPAEGRQTSVSEASRFVQRTQEWVWLQFQWHHCHCVCSALTGFLLPIGTRDLKTGKWKTQSPLSTTMFYILLPRGLELQTTQYKPKFDE